MKMREDAFGGILEQRVMQRTDLVPRHTRAIHSGINGEMPWTARLAPPIDRRGVAERRREIAANGGVEVADENRRENQNRATDSRPSQLLALPHGGDAEAPRVEAVENARDAFSPQAV